MILESVTGWTIFVFAAGGWTHFSEGETFPSRDMCEAQRTATVLELSATKMHPRLICAPADWEGKTHATGGLPA